MVDYKYQDEENIIGDVQLIDLRNVTHLPKGKCVKRMLAGNETGAVRKRTLGVSLASELTCSPLVSS